MGIVGYGVIGLGFFGEKHAEVAAALPGVALRAVCTRDDDRRRAVAGRLGVPAAYRDYHDLLADPAVEAVSVVTHVEDHAEPTVAALRAGKDVFVEKPLARSLADCDRMIAAARETGRFLFVGHVCRFNPRYAVARERVRAGALGRIVSLFARRNIPAARSAVVLPKVSPILGDGVHDIDLMHWFTGERVTSVFARTHGPRGLPHPDVAWTTLTFAGGAIGVVENVWMLPPGTPFRIHEQLEVIGTEGALYLHGNDGNLVVQTAGGVECPDTVYWPTVHGVPAGALRTEMGYFVDCVARRRPPAVVTPEEAREAVAVALAAEESARSGRVVER